MKTEMPEYAMKSFAIVKAPYFFMGLPAKALSLLVYLIWRQGQYEWCWPRRKDMVLHSGLSGGDQLDKYLTYLRDEGLIEIGACKNGTQKFRVIPLEIVFGGPQEATGRAQGAGEGENLVKKPAARQKAKKGNGGSSGESSSQARKKEGEE